MELNSAEKTNQYNYLTEREELSTVAAISNKLQQLTHGVSFLRTLSPWSLIQPYVSILF